METATKLEDNEDKLLEKHQHNIVFDNLNKSIGSRSENVKISSKCRTQLWYILFFGFAIDQMTRININIAIVDMIAIQNINKLNSNSSTSMECYSRLPEVIDDDKIKNLNITNTIKKYRFSIERHMLDLFKISYDKDGFEWNERKQSQIIGSYFWLHALLALPGGFYAKKYGTKLVFGYSILIGSLLNIFIPIFSYIDIRLTIFIRIVQGFISGVNWASAHNMIGRWIPPNERSNFVTSYLGNSFGVWFFFTFFGYVTLWFSWEWVFYICAVFGSIWFTFWKIFVYDSPLEHPDIELDEKNYIEKSLHGLLNKTKSQQICVPWKKIFQSPQIWVVLIAQLGATWGMLTILAQTPTYFKVILGWNVGMSGLLTGLPHLCRILPSKYFAKLGDYFLHTNRISRTNLRRFACSISNIGSAIFLIGLAYAGCNSTLAVIFLMIAVTLTGAVTTGTLASIVDLSPNFAGIIMGMCGIIHVIPGFLSPYIVGVLTSNNQSLQQWKYIYLLSAMIMIITGFCYIIFGKAEVLKWNNESQPLSQHNKNDTELKNIDYVECIEKN